MTCVKHPVMHHEEVLECSALTKVDEKFYKYTKTSDVFILKESAERFVAAQNNLKGAEETHDSKAIISGIEAVLAGNQL